MTVICRLLGVPREDEPRFHAWADAIVAGLDPDPAEDPAERQRVAQQARTELGLYLAELIEERRRAPGDDMLSALATDHGPDGQMTPMELITTAVLLLIAGHETTVNLITNGMLTLLRNPDVLKRLRDEPGLAVPLVEELLRYEPPVQLLPQRTAARRHRRRRHHHPQGRAPLARPGLRQPGPPAVPRPRPVRPRPRGTTSTSASAAASTTASARPSPVWRRSSR